MTTQLSDSAADVQANIDTLQSEISSGQVTSISLTDAGTPTLTLTAAQVSNDAGALNAISGSYDIVETGVGALNVQVAFLNPHVTAVSVADNGLSIGLELDVLESYARAGKLTSISLTGGSSLTVTQAQLASDTDALAKVSSSVSLAITAPAGGGSVTGLAGHSNIAEFTGLASQFTFTGSTDHQTLTVNGGGNSYQLSNVQAVQFTDGTQLFVAQTPGDAAHVNTGNITELYSAVLAREPDLAGLAFYQTYLANHPATGLQQFATWFLDSNEYSSNTAHNYAQSTAGDQQFITDSYSNLLHRTPDSAEIAYYQNVIAPYIKGQASGTAAYTNAEAQAHALVLTYFSQSPEFLTDVQVTATNTGSAQHWLVLT